LCWQAGQGALFPFSLNAVCGCGGRRRRGSPHRAVCGDPPRLQVVCPRQRHDRAGGGEGGSSGRWSRRRLVWSSTRVGPGTPLRWRVLIYATPLPWSLTFRHKLAVFFFFFERTGGAEEPLLTCCLFARTCNCHL
jgi:hypothetical protein